MSDRIIDNVQGNVGGTDVRYVEVPEDCFGRAMPASEIRARGIEVPRVLLDEDLIDAEGQLVAKAGTVISWALAVEHGLVAEPRVSVPLSQMIETRSERR